MKAADAKIYRRMKDIPHRNKIILAGKEALHQCAERIFKQQSEARAARNAHLEPYYEALRAAAKKSPQLDEVRNAISSGAKKRPKMQPTSPPRKAPAPKATRLTRGSVHLVDIPPFQALTSSTTNGFGEIFGPTADGNQGTMSFSIFGGADSSGAGSGTFSCWTALGQEYFPPEEGILMFSASPSFNWWELWMSNWWRLAAGDLWIGQVINQFDSNGVFIDTPVVTQISLNSFSDNNFSDSGFQSGSSSGDLLSSQLFVLDDCIYECWVWMGGWETCDWSNNQSLANISLSATLSSLTLDLV